MTELAVVVVAQRRFEGVAAEAPGPGSESGLRVALAVERQCAKVERAALLVFRADPDAEGASPRQIAGQHPIGGLPAAVEHAAERRGVQVFVADADAQPMAPRAGQRAAQERKSTRLNSSHSCANRMPS